MAVRLLAGVNGAALMAVLLTATLSSAASASSFDSRPGPRPGPAILNETPAVAPELTNSGVWEAAPTRVPRTTAYRNGEFLY